MDAFENIVSDVLYRLGYWTATSFKVELTKEEKAAIGRQSSPRWELDIIAYSPKLNELLIVECKSFLDSRGVTSRAFTDMKTRVSKRYKLFNEHETYRVVASRLRKQLMGLGLILPKAKIRLGLAAGKISSKAEAVRLDEHFKTKGWVLFTPEWIREQMIALADQSYDNSIASVAAKILLRGQQKPSD